MERWRLAMIVPLGATVLTIIGIVVVGEFLLAVSPAEEVGHDALFEIGHSEVRMAVIVALALSVIILAGATIADRMSSRS